MFLQPDQKGFHQMGGSPLESHMANEQHSEKIDLNDPQQVAHWANLLNITEARLRSLVGAFGDDCRYSYTCRKRARRHEFSLLPVEIFLYL